MNISQLHRLRQIGDDEFQSLPSPRQSDKAGFGSAIRNALDSVDEAQKAADGEIEAFVAGEQENLHDVMISMNQAKLTFQLMTEVRNRMLETYQELMRMQV